MTSPETRSDDAPDEPTARVLCDTAALAAAAPTEAAVAWKLTESGRQLDANLVRLTPGRHVAPHAEPDLDVLLLVVSGEGVLGGRDGAEEAEEADVEDPQEPEEPQDAEDAEDAGNVGDGPRPLTPGALVWLPRGSTRSITASDDGLAYLTVHVRRPGMQIGRAR
ncbi:hypothetical protein [Streptomyces spinosirectus]